MFRFQSRSCTEIDAGEVDQMRPRDVTRDAVKS